MERIFRGHRAQITVTSLPEQVIVDMNDSWTTSLGYATAEVIGREAIEHSDLLNGNE